MVDTGLSSGAAGLGQLTEREVEVLAVVGQGLSDGDLADALVIPPRTPRRRTSTA